MGVGEHTLTKTVPTTTPQITNDLNNSGKLQSHTSRLHYAENDDDEPRPDTGKAADMLQRLRNLSEENPSDHYQHMDDHNDEIRELVEKLNDAGVDAMPFVAHRLAAEDERKSSEAMDGNPDFAGISSPGWADEPFNGSGPDPQLWMSDSASYVDEHERPDFDDVTDLPDGDLIKFNDSRSAPQQGPRHGSRYYADGPATLGDYSNMNGFDPGSYTDGDSALGGENTVMASYRYADDDGYVGDGMANGYFNPDNPTAEDWEEGSGTPFLHQLEHSSDEMDPTSHLTGGGKGGEAGEGAVAGEEGGGAAELLAENPELLALAASRHSPRGGFSVEAFDQGGFSYDDGGPLRAAHRVGGGPTQQVRIDPGTRGQQRRAETYNPPEDFGYDGETTSYGEPSADPGMGADIMASFQRSAAALEMMHGAQQARPGSIDDFGSSPMVQSMLRKTAGRKYSPEEQRMLEAENHPLGARNLPTDDDLRDTHYLLG
jgi:hypothetical protein